MKSFKSFFDEYSNRSWFIFVCFIVFWPFALYLMWRYNKWNLRTRVAITAVISTVMFLFGVAIYNAPPEIVLSNIPNLSKITTDDKYISIDGNVSNLHASTLVINGEKIELANAGNFIYKLQLKEGDNSVVLIAKSDKGVDKKSFKVHRTTKAEFTEREQIAKRQAEENKRVAEEKAKKVRADAIKAMSVCDGKTTISNCKLDNVIYEKYIYHPAVPEKTHKVTETNYKEEITGYCTLCNDGTYSPSCSTGRGTCSHHGGVAEWNAPRTSRVPVYTDRIVVDEPAVAEYYEKALDRDFY